MSRVEPMILPGVDPATGEIERRAWSRDVRVPGGLEFPPRLVAGGNWSPCTGGRHLWDAVEAVDNEVEDDAGECTQRFRLVLTCVNCGLVQRLEGVADTGRGASGRLARLDPAPLRAGSLRAQQIRHDRIGSRDCSTWAVCDESGRRVGSITWGCTRRGRHYYAGRLDCWPSGVVVEAPTPLACLRKVARQAAAAPVGGER
jgi:hypothetical protein